jgi:hypothetical protein
MIILCAVRVAVAPGPAIVIELKEYGLFCLTVE